MFFYKFFKSLIIRKDPEPKLVISAPAPGSYLISAPRLSAPQTVSNIPSPLPLPPPPYFVCYLYLPWVLLAPHVELWTTHTCDSVYEILSN